MLHLILQAAAKTQLIGKFALASLLLLSVQHTAADTLSSDELLVATQQAQQTERLATSKRVDGFHKTEAQLQQELKDLKQKQASLDKETQLLASNFQKNEELLAKKEKDLFLAAGSLGELFGVVRQSAKDLQLEQKASVASIGQEAHLAIVDELVAARQLPSTVQLYGLWDALQQQIDASSQLEIVEVSASSGSGEVTQVPALRLGSFALFNDSGYLNWNGQSQRASSYAAQPEFTPTLAMQSDLVGALPIVSLDATRGDLIAQLANAPTLQDRIEHGGIIGQIIIGLLFVGAFIGMVRGAVLLLTKTKISRQLKSPQTPSNNNALGRVLNVYQQDQSPNVEALELRLLEAVMDEQQQLERGLSMIKLLAALAPMLGLLGTVTGMIETFQTITQFGNADPRIMAGGISMALMTTVLGLIAAMPLLLIHNILSSQAEDIRNTIEKQGIGLVAQRAEQLAEKEAA